MDEKKPETFNDPNEPISEEEEVAQENRNYIGINQPDITTAKFDAKDLEYLQSDSTWEQLKLDNSLAQRLIQLGYKKPSFIQQQVIRLAGASNVVAQSQNGSGKTLAYLIPILSKLEEIKDKPQITIAQPKVLIIGDTKALIMQIHKQIQRVSEGYKRLNIDYVFGGKTNLNKYAQILISTLAQIKLAAQKKSLNFDEVEQIVVDEADHVFESDFNRNFFQAFLAKLMKNPKFKVIFTSATMTEDFKKVISYVQSKQNIILLEIPVEKLTLHNVLQFMFVYKNFEQKLYTLEKLISTIRVQNILIFDNRKADLPRLKNYLLQKNYKVAHVYRSDVEPAEGNLGDFIQKQIDDFLAGKYRILLTTNLLSRGIDMRKVTLVVNFSLPFKLREEGSSRIKEVDLETYLHRVGRTGRFGDHGIALNFVNTKQEQEMIKQIQDYYKVDIKELKEDELEGLNDRLDEIQNINKEKREYLEESI